MPSYSDGDHSNHASPMSRETAIRRLGSAIPGIITLLNTIIGLKPNVSDTGTDLKTALTSLHTRFQTERDRDVVNAVERLETFLTDLASELGG
jgi:hypothetical protein